MNITTSSYNDLRHNGTYRLRARVVIDGQTFNKSATYHPKANLTDQANQNAAEEMAAKFAEAFKNKLLADMAGKDPTFGNYFRSDFMEKGAIYLAPTTFAFYVKAIEKIMEN